MEKEKIIEQHIGEIKKAMLDHNEDDKNHFSRIIDKIDTNHDVHIRNEETLKNILAESKKTNGRVTSLEAMIQSLDTANKLLSQIVSQQHDQYLKFVTQYEKIKEKEDSTHVKASDFEPVKKIVYGMVALILTGVMGAILTLILK